MKKVSGLARISFLCLLSLTLISCSNAGKKNSVRTIIQKLRGVIKGWVYNGWIKKENFFEVIPGELYRSSQLPPYKLEQLIKRYNIKTIVNLSGDEPHYWISQQEKQLADNYGVVLFNTKTHALVVTPLEKVRTLIAISLSAPLPILFHCFAGSDRTGESCALHMLATNRGVQRAISQLSPKFGHKKWLFPYKYHLITNIEKMYPNLVDNLKKLCNKRFSYDDLKDVAADDLYFKIIDRSLKREAPPA